MDFLEICARMTSACPWPEDAEEQPALTASESRIVSACAGVASELLSVPETWPDGWWWPDDTSAMSRDMTCKIRPPLGGGGYIATIESPTYETVEEAKTSARRAVWAIYRRGSGREAADAEHAEQRAKKAEAEMVTLRTHLKALESQRAPAAIDREALAKALISGGDSAFGDGWVALNERGRRRWLWIADTAIRLCAGADVGARIADLEAQIQRLQDRLTSAESGREDFRKAYNAAIDDSKVSRERLTAAAYAAVERAEKAEATSRLWEEESAAIHEALRDVGAPLPLAKVEARIRGMKRQIEANTAEATERHVAEAARAILDGKGYNATGMGDTLYSALRALKCRILESEVAINALTDERAAATAHATQMLTDRREMIDHAERLLKRAEEAEVRAARAEKALRLSADAAEAATTDEEDARQELYDARAENDRLRRALYIATQATAHMSTVAALLTGEADDA